MGIKPQSLGLLSKVASIFRAPENRAGHVLGKDGAESQQSRVDESEKNALQALIHRKRQDDLVRRREFNYLRKLRRSPQNAGHWRSDSSERISAFSPSSGYSVDVRASTLKKIDAIEAHMIGTWARSKAALMASSTDNKGAAQLASGAAVYDFVPTRPAPLSTEVSHKPRDRLEVADSAAADTFDSMDLDFTGLLSTPGSTAVDTWEAPSAGVNQPVHRLAPSVAIATTPVPRPVPTSVPTLAPALSTTLRRADPPVLQELVVPAPPQASPQPLLQTLPEHIESALQDAAIQFAEGDATSAEASLLSLLQAHGVTPATADVLASALFDLYRATGQQDGFDVVAMDYAERFGRSPGEWFSLPQRLKSHATSTVAPPVNGVLASGEDPVWDAPPRLTLSAVRALRSPLFTSTSVWHMDWVALTDIEAEAAPALCEVMAYWCTTAVSLHWSGIDSLLRALERNTPADNNTVDPLWWQLRLNALCILQRHDDFESLALDFCVVYEVSPPSWKAPLCHLVRDLSPSEFGTLADNPPSVFGDDLPVLAGPVASFELLGELVGEAQETMGRLVATVGSASHVVVSCALVVRCDFAAAGALLNWVMDRHAHECQVQLVQVPRLVAVFFQMFGIDRYAKILVRAN